ncbi:hypothetical protein GCM10027284_46310 [Cyclobacterium sediminis]
MKNLHVVSIFKLFLLLLSLLTASCKEDAFFDPVGGSIGGVVLYRDYLTNELDTASNAVIKITSEHGPKTQTYELEANNGRFEANFLIKGIEYIIDISYSSNLYEYSKNTTFKVENSNPELYILEVNTESELFRARLSGRLIYTDITMDQDRVASGAMVELTAGSKIYTATADSNGEFVFENLLHGTYDLEATLRQNINGLFPIWYKKTWTNSEITANQLNSNDGKLSLDIPSIFNPMAIIKVKNSDEIRFPNAEVFLYGSATSLKSDSLRIASVANGTSNERGIVLFGNLDPATYYIHGRVITGEDTVTFKEIGEISWGENENLAEYTFELNQIEEK